MLPYIERSAQLTLDSTVAVLVLSNPDVTDVELLPLQPCPMSESEKAELGARLPGRNLIKTVGVIGLVRGTPRVCLKEPLEPPQIDRLAAAFLTHIAVLLGDNFADVMRDAEVAELERLHTLADTRTEA